MDSEARTSAAAEIVGRLALELYRQSVVPLLIEATHKRQRVSHKEYDILFFNCTEAAWEAVRNQYQIEPPEGSLNVAWDRVATILRKEPGEK